MKEIISPFSFLTEEQSEIEMKKIEQEKEEFKRRIRVSNNRGMVVANENANVIKKRKPICNSTNPFINACKKTFDFIKDNMNVSVNVGGVSTSPVGIIQNHLEKYSFKPKVTTRIQAGPIDIEIDSDTIAKNISKGGVITH